MMRSPLVGAPALQAGCRSLTTRARDELHVCESSMQRVELHLARAVAVRAFLLECGFAIITFNGSGLGEGIKWIKFHISTLHPEWHCAKGSPRRSRHSAANRWQSKGCA